MDPVEYYGCVGVLIPSLRITDSRTQDLVARPRLVLSFFRFTSSVSFPSFGINNARWRLFCHLFFRRLFFRFLFSGCDSWRLCWGPFFSSGPFLAFVCLLSIVCYLLIALHSYLLALHSMCALLSHAYCAGCASVSLLGGSHKR